MLLGGFFYLSHPSGIAKQVKTRLRVLRAGFGSALADKFLTESVCIPRSVLTQSELVPRLSIACHNPHLRYRLEGGFLRLS